MRKKEAERDGIERCFVLKTLRKLFGKTLAENGRTLTANQSVTNYQAFYPEAWVSS